MHSQLTCSDPSKSSISVSIDRVIAPSKEWARMGRKRMTKMREKES